MKYYFEANKGNQNNTIRIHPVLLSVTQMVHAAETNPNITIIPEDDERVLNDGLYTSPGDFLPFEVHFSGQNCLSLRRSPLSPKWLTLKSAAGCGECTAFLPQDDLLGEEEATQGSSAEICHAQEDDLWGVKRASLRSHSKRKKHRRGSSRYYQDNLSTTRGSKAARVMYKSKGKKARKIGASIEKSDKSSQESHEDRDGEVEPRMFTRASVQGCADGICRLLKIKMAIQAQSKALNSRSRL